MANEKPIRPVNDRGVNDDTGYFHGSAGVGNDPLNFNWGVTKGALHFTSVDINQGQTISMAHLVMPYSAWGVGSGSWKFIAYGINEDNTSTFSSSPFGRSKTSQTTVVNEGPPGSGGQKDLDVTSIVQAIVNRGGWSNGNSMGFLLEDNGSSTDVGAYFGSASYLVYRINAEPNFKPTPKTVGEPTFPSVDDYGIKISFPGESVIGATANDELLFTTRKDYLKIIDEGLVSVTAGVPYTIAHGLSYKPKTVCFLRSGGTSIQLPRFFEATGLNGFFQVDSSDLIINTTQSVDVYYYIFADQLAS